MRGERSGSYAITEDAAGSDARSLKATAVRDAATGDYVLNGEKWFVTGPDDTDFMIFHCNVVDGDQRLPTLFLVDYDVPGVRVSHDPDYMHTFADRHPQFVLEDVRVPADAILGSVGAADALTNEWFVEERIHIGARCAGAMERLLTLAVEWATERVQFGERIYDFQGVSFPLADSAADASAARLLTRETAWLADTGADPKVVHAKASLAKLFASEAAFRCADRVVQVFGGRGYMREFAGRAVLPRAPRRPDLGGHVRDPATHRRPGARAARRRPGGRVTGVVSDSASTPDEAPVPCPGPPRDGGVIDLRPLFAPTSVAVVGASPRSWIAETVRDNLRAMGSATRCHFVNPKYDELHGQPCYPSLEALPERPDIAILAVSTTRAASMTEAAAAAGVPAVIIPGGGVVEGGEAAAAMQAEVARIAREHGLALVGPNCMGVIDLVTNSATYIGDVSPYLPRGGVAGIAQSGSVTDAFVHSGSRIGFSRIISCGSEVVLDVCDYLAYCLDDPETSSVILFVEGFKRPERFLALADRALELGKPIMVVKVGRSQQAQVAAIAHSGSLAGEARVTDAALDAAGVIVCADLDHLLETAELVEGTRRTGRAVGRGRTGVVTVSTGEASLIADQAPQTGIDLPPLPESARAAILAALPTMGYIANPLDPWGAAEPAIAYGASFEAMAASGAYDVLAIVHDFPYRSLPSEVATANEVTSQLLEATRERPSILPVYVSLTSGEPPPETKELLDTKGSGAPLLRGGLEAFTAIASVARWETRRDLRRTLGPWRGGWPALAADRTSHGADPEPVPPRAAAAASTLRAREPRVRRCGGDRRDRRRSRSVTRRRPSPRPGGWVGPWPSSSMPPASSTRARSAAWRWVWPMTTRSTVRPSRCSRAPASGASRRGGCSSSRWRRPASSSSSGSGATRCSGRPCWSASAGS